MTAALVIDLDDLPSFRRIIELGIVVFDHDDDAYHLAAELLDALDQGGTA